MLAEALQAEVDDYIARFAGERDENGRRLVVRNGSHQPREVLTSAGAVEVTAPRVNDRRTDADTGQRARFSSAILPPWCRKTPKITEVLPLLYLHGLSTGDFVPALGQFLGSSAGLSAPVITKLTEAWKAEQRAFAARICPVWITSTCGSTGSTSTSDWRSTSCACWSWSGSGLTGGRSSSR
jgi:transposase-like protein